MDALRRTRGAVDRRTKKLRIAYHWSRTGDYGRSEFDCVTCKANRLHKHRNCRKFFPEDFDPTRTQLAWKAIYRDSKKLERPVPGTECTECPRSLITPQSGWLLEQYIEAERAHKAMGGTLYGTDSARWPAWWWDTVVTVRLAENEAAAIENGQ